MKPPIVIEKAADFDALIEQLMDERHIAIDTESNSFYAYYEQVCLIQISTTREDYILDPLTLSNIEQLEKVTDNPDIEKIFHAASNDVLGFKRDFKFRINNIFDTAIASKLLGYKQLGLSKILQEHFGVVLNKKWQRYDWGKRPLIQEQIDYARLDTHFLIELRHLLAASLEKQQLLEAAREAFEKASLQEFQERAFQPDSFIQITGAQSLDTVGKRILRALYLYRDTEARRRNRAPFRILPNDTLVRLAHNRPKNIRDFSKIKGVPRPYHHSRAAHSLLEVIRKTEAYSEERSIRN